MDKSIWFFHILSLKRIKELITEIIPEEFRIYNFMIIKNKKFYFEYNR